MLGIEPGPPTMTDDNPIDREEWLSHREFINLWIDHTNKLSRLKWHLPDQSDRDEITLRISQLQELVEKAAKNRQQA